MTDIRQKMLMSVVITTYNRSEVLKQNLDEFKKQTDKNFEVIVAIDGSTDDTINMLEDYECDFPLRWIDTGETNKYCLSKARNMGIVASQGKAVIILDDDSFPVPEFISEHRRTVTSKVLTGGYRNSHDPNDLLHAKMVKINDLYGDCNPGPFRTLIVENNCCMFRSYWVGCGMFNERLEGYGGTGQEFIHRIIYQGYGYQFNSKAMIYHHREYEGNNGLTRNIKNKQAMKNVEKLMEILGRFQGKL